MQCDRVQFASDAILILHFWKRNTLKIYFLIYNCFAMFFKRTAFSKHRYRIASFPKTFFSVSVRNMAAWKHEIYLAASFRNVLPSTCRYNVWTKRCLTPGFERNRLWTAHAHENACNNDNYKGRSYPPERGKKGKTGGT